VSVDEALSILRSVDPRIDASLVAMSDLPYDENGVAAAETLLDDPEPIRRWAATWVYANGGMDAAQLRPRLEDPEPQVQLLAAVGLAFRGEQAGLRRLVEALRDPAPTWGVDPPQPVWLIAAQNLVRLTERAEHGPPFDGDDQDAAEAADRWTAWLDEHQATLHFADDGVWRPRAQLP
jgi:HEAT repeat protein